MEIEKQYDLTRSCLIVLSELHIPCYVCTKADPDIISRDLDIMKFYQAPFIVVLGLSNLKQLEKAESCDKTENMEFARCLHALGIEVWAFIMPVLPGITDVGLMMDSLPDEIPVWLHRLQARAEQKNGKRLLAFIKRKYPHLTSQYEDILQGEEDVYYQELKKDLGDNTRVKFPYG